jgi:hypothetical protein
VEQNLAKDTETNYEYDYEIAVTRNDIRTKDTGASADYRMHYHDYDVEHGKVGTGHDCAVVNKEVHVTAAWESHGTGWTRTNLA